MPTTPPLPSVGDFVRLQPGVTWAGRELGSYLLEVVGVHAYSAPLPTILQVKTPGTSLRPEYAAHVSMAEVTEIVYA